MRFIKSFISLFLLIIVFGIFSTKTVSAATVTLSGKVSDSSGTGIENVSISVTDAVSGANAGNTTTDTSGNYNLIIFNEGTYNVQVTPPAGSGFSSAIALNQNIFTDKIINFILVPTGTVTLSGHIYDELGNPTPNQVIELKLQPNGVPQTTHTDSSGYYSIQAVSGTYSLSIGRSSTDFSVNVPQDYSIFAQSYPLAQSTVLDITIPARKVSIHVQDASGNAVSNVGIQVLPTSGQNHIINTNLFLGANINATGMSQYPYSDITKTDASGNIDLWLLPTDSNSSYTLTAIPPSGSNYSNTSSTFTVSTDVAKTITLPQTITLSGHIYDELGNPTPNQGITLKLQPNGVPQTTHTDSSGYYSLNTLPGNYTLSIARSVTDNSVNVPEDYFLYVNTYSLTQSTILDITIPARKVSIHVQDASGNAVSNVGIQVLPTAGQNHTVNSNLFIGGSITNASGMSQYISTAFKTDASGNVVLWLFPTDSSNSYTFTALPPNGSSFITTTIPNVTIAGDTTKIITLQQPNITLSGHIYDELGSPVPNQGVQLKSTSTTNTRTDASGAYSLQVASGIFTLSIGGGNGNSLSISLPQDYIITVPSYSLTQSTILDITIPAKKILVHIQDQFNNPVVNVGVGALPSVGQNAIINNNLSIGGNITNAAAMSQYPGKVKTDTSGNATLWLLPTDSNHSYTLTAIPPSGSIYAPFTLNNISIIGDQAEIISLQYNHAAPSTIISLETQHADGTYSNPTTVTLSATPASGYTVASTYYTIDGGSPQTYSGSFTVTGSGNHIITYWSVDNSGVQETHNTKTFTIYSNQAPVVNPLSDTTINEGDTFTKDGSFTDPDPDTWTATVDYGDGSGVQPLTLNNDKTFSLNHIYQDNKQNNMPHNVTINIIDNQGTTGTQTALVTVKNVAPSIGSIIIPADPVAVNTPITVSAPFTDPGVLDTHYATWDWGDTSANGTVTEASGSGSVSDSHTYTQAGVYTITLTVTDKDLGSDTKSATSYVVVYDPSAGFVTGGGWITSPQGAYAQDSALTGKANFGFVSKYQKGANTPSGNTEFNFSVANFNFHSTSYDWLVIAGSKAQYKGTGTINGNGSYKFILSAIDGNPDKFRLKVWNPADNTVIYDNQSGASDTGDPATAISGGSIVIHQ